MKRCILISGLLLILSASMAQAKGFDGSYTARTGDLNSDGRTDIYLRHSKTVAVPVGDVEVPIQIRSDVDEFVLQQTSTGEFNIVSSLSGTQLTAVRQWAVQPAIALTTRDLNMDGAYDVLEPLTK